MDNKRLKLLNVVAKIVSKFPNVEISVSDYPTQFEIDLKLNQPEEKIKELKK